MASPLETAYANLEAKYLSDEISGDEFSSQYGALKAAEDDWVTTTFAKSAAKSAAGMVPGAMVGLGRATGYDAMAEKGEEWEGDLDRAFQVNPDDADSVAAKLGGGFGSVAGIMLPAGAAGLGARALVHGASKFTKAQRAAQAAGRAPGATAAEQAAVQRMGARANAAQRAAGTGAGATTAVGASGGEGVKDYESTMASDGMPVDYEMRQEVAQSNLPAGMLDYILPSKLLKQGGKIFGKTPDEMRAAVAAGKSPVSVKGATASGVAGGMATEGATEAAQQAWLNEVARRKYDYDRAVTEGVVESAAIGATVGGSLKGTANFMQAKRFNLTYDQAQKKIEEAVSAEEGRVAQEEQESQKMQEDRFIEEILHQTEYAAPNEAYLAEESWVQDEAARTGVSVGQLVGDLKQKIMDRIEATPGEEREAATFDPTLSKTDYVTNHPEFKEAQLVGTEQQQVMENGAVVTKTVVTDEKANKTATDAALNDLGNRYDKLQEDNGGVLSVSMQDQILDAHGKEPDSRTLLGLGVDVDNQPEALRLLNKRWEERNQEAVAEEQQAAVAAADNAKEARDAIVKESQEFDPDISEEQYILDHPEYQGVLQEFKKEQVTFDADGKRKVTNVKSNTKKRAAALDEKYTELQKRYNLLQRANDIGAERDIRETVPGEDVPDEAVAAAQEAAAGEEGIVAMEQQMLEDRGEMYTDNDTQSPYPEMVGGPYPPADSAPPVRKGAPNTMPAVVPGEQTWGGPYSNVEDAPVPVVPETQQETQPGPQAEPSFEAPRKTLADVLPNEARKEVAGTLSKNQVNALRSAAQATSKGKKQLDHRGVAGAVLRALRIEAEGKATPKDVALLAKYREVAPAAFQPSVQTPGNFLSGVGKGDQYAAVGRTVNPEKEEAIRSVMNNTGASRHQVIVKTVAALRRESTASNTAENVNILDAYREGNPDTFARKGPAQYVEPEQQSKGPQYALASSEDRAENFQEWSEGAPVVPMGEWHDYESGEPVVMEMVHGTTHDIETVDPTKGNPESDLGAGFYVSNTPGDVESNYAGEGPDLTQRIETMAERISNEIYDDPTGFGLPESITDNQDAMDREGMKRAREALIGGPPRTMKVFVRFSNPAVIGGTDGTMLDQDQVEDLIATIEENVPEWIDTATVAEDLRVEAFDYEGISLDEAMQMLKESDVGMAESDEGGAVGNEVIRGAIESLGFDGIIDTTVNRKFGNQKQYGRGMEGMNSYTVHAVPFGPNQVKSATGNTGEFSRTDNRITHALRTDSSTQAAASAAVHKEAIRRNNILTNNGVGLTVEVVDTADQIPDVIRRDLRPGDRPRAVLLGDRVYLFSQNLTGAEDARRAVIHEVVGHFGVRGLYGVNVDTYNRMLDKLYPSLHDQAIIDQITSSYGGRTDLTTVEGKRKLVEEYIAHKAESRFETDPGFFKRLYNLVRQQLRKWGILNTTDAEIKALLDASYARTLESGANGYLQQTSSVRKMKAKQEKNAPVTMTVIDRQGANVQYTDAGPGAEVHQYNTATGEVGTVVAIAEEDGIKLTGMDVQDMDWAKVLFMEEFRRAHSLGAESVKVPSQDPDFDKWLGQNFNASIETDDNGVKVMRVNVIPDVDAEPAEDVRYSNAWGAFEAQYALAPGTGPQSEADLKAKDRAFSAFARNLTDKTIDAIPSLQLRKHLQGLNNVVNATWHNMPMHEVVEGLRSRSLGAIDKMQSFGNSLLGRADAYTKEQLEELNRWLDSGGLMYNPTPAQIEANPPPSFLSARDHTLLREARFLLTEIGEDLVKLHEEHGGWLTAEKFEENKDVYAPALYADYIKNGGTVGGKKISLQHYLKQKKITDSDLVAKISKATRGEVTDPFFRMGVGIATAGRDAALGRYFGALLKHPQLVLSEEFNRLADPRTGGTITLPSAVKILVDNGYTVSPTGNVEKKLKSRGVYQSDPAVRSGAAAEIQQLADNVSAQLTQTVKDSEGNDIVGGLHQILRQHHGDLSPTDMLKVLSTEYKMVHGPQYGPLSGRIIRTELAEDIDEAISPSQDSKHPAWKKVEDLTSTWKKLKVPLNPVSQIRNTVGNLFLLDIGTDTNFGTLMKDTGGMFRSFYDTKQSAVDLHLIRLDTKDENQLARWIVREMGGGAATFSSAELQGNRTRLDRAIKEFEKIGEEKGGVAAWASTVKWATKYGDVMMENYQKMEQVFKAVAVKDYLRKVARQTDAGNVVDMVDALMIDGPRGIEPSPEMQVLMRNAMAHANESIFDYSRVSPAVNKLRRSPIGAPFITFTMKAIPATLKAHAHRPQKMIKYYALPMLLAGMATDWDDEELERIERDRPDWMKKKGSMWVIPVKGDDGKMLWVDMGYFLPQSYLTDVVKSMSTWGDFHDKTDLAKNVGGTVLGASALMAGPLVDIVMAASTNTNRFTRRDIVQEGATPEDALKDVLTYGWDFVAPSFVGSASGLASITGLADTMDPRTGEPKRSVGQNVARVFGVNSYAIDPDAARRINRRIAMNEIRKVQTEMKRKMKDKNTGNRAEVRLEYNEYIRHLRERMQAQRG